MPTAEPAQLHYRVYFITSAGHVAGPPEVIASNSDQEAVERAKQLLDGRDIEIWQGARVVTRLRPDEK
jgi:hypothetical protein